MTEKANTREVAVAITNQIAIGCWWYQSEGWVIDAIDKAPQKERERCAKIAEDILPIGADDCYWCERVNRAVAAIRNPGAEGKVSNGT